MIADKASATQNKRVQLDPLSYEVSLFLEEQDFLVYLISSLGIDGLPLLSKGS